ncbi:MAG: tyrosine-type recombinase/integrase [Rhodocyclaceae bacterium]|nr:tyrosine-type recombinase/integrase [Rhodocyclaceae bacterium]
MLAPSDPPALGEMPLPRFIEIKHVNVVRGRNGKAYHYHRKTGERLPDEEGARAIKVLEINAKLAALETSNCPDDGTMRALIIHFKESPDYKRKIRPRTRADYQHYLDILQDRFGALSVRDIGREDVIGLRDVFQDRPRVADYFVQVLSRLLSFALNFPRRYGLQQHPAQRIGKLSGDGAGYRAWPDNVVSAARAAAAPELRWAIDLVLYTGQRPGDAIRMTWASLDGNTIRLEQGKTGTPLRIRIHRDLGAALETMKRRQLTILTNSRGLPWKGKALQHRITGLMKEIGFPGYSLHGLRKRAGKTLAESGCSAKEIQAILGHLTLEECERYTREADQAKLANSAILRWEKADDLQNALTGTAKQNGGGT